MSLLFIITENNKIIIVIIIKVNINNFYNFTIQNYFNLQK